MDFLPTNRINSKENTSGQALLLVLLTMAVVLTVVLSILSRTVTDITVTTREEEALRAFSAAEAGVEKALIVGTVSDEDFGENASFIATVTDFGEGESEYVYPEELFSGETAVFWFVNHDDNGSLACSVDDPCFTGDRMTICWGQDDTPNNNDQTPAVEISIFYAEIPWDFSTVKIARVTADPQIVGRKLSNKFDDVTGRDCSLGGQGFEFWKDVDFTSPAGLGIPYATEGNLLFAKVRLLYNTDDTHGVGIDITGSGSVLYSQGLRIESVGTSGEANRKVEVFQTYGELPPIFDAVLFNPIGGISK